MAREVDEESKSYSAVFLVAVGLLLLGSIWSIWDDNIARRPWKKYQTAFFDMERAKVQADLDAEQKRLDQDPKYKEIIDKLDKARAEVSSGEAAAQRAALDRELETAKVKESEWDLQLRIVKSEIEEARYEYEHAIELGESGKPEREHLGAKEADKKEIDERYAAAQKHRGGIEEKIAEMQSRVRLLEDELGEVTTDRDRLALKLEGLTINFDVGFATLHFPRVPKIEQVVLDEFDRNAYDQP
ncbi:MAG: hypothetical protein ACREQ9_14605, partial [Candidatus Binatia bacterium]